MLLKIKTFGFQINYSRYEKKIGDKIIHLKKIYKSTPDHFLIGHKVFFSIIKKIIKNKKFHFAPNRCGIRKNVGEQNSLLQKICKFALCYYSMWSISFLLFIKNAFIKIKNSIFPPKYTRYGKNVEKKFFILKISTALVLTTL